MTTEHAAAGIQVPDNPGDLTRQDYVAALKRTMKEVKDDDVPGLASGVAFKIFLSIFPALFAAVAIFSLVTTVSELTSWLESAGGFLPEAAADLIRKPLLDLVSAKTSALGFAAIAGVATGIWAATGAAVSLMKALSRAYDVPETRKFARQRLDALFLTIALLAALLAVAGLLVLGPQLQTLVLGDVTAPLSWVFAAARLLLVLAVLLVLFAFVYWLGPNRDHPSWVWISPGALLGVTGWLVASGGFTFYAQNLGSGSYERTYGTIAGVAILLIWLQISMMVILIGAEFNAEVERTRSVHLRVAEGAGFAALEGTAAHVEPPADAPEATLVQTEAGAHTVTPTDESSSPTIPEAPALSDAGVSSSRSGPRKAGAIAAGLMACAVFLGLARRRARR